ncbi:MAG: heme exporter protein CcmB, partial [Spirochaetota bacterium]
MADTVFQIKTLMRKDLLLEFRSRAMIQTSVSFALCAVITAGIAFGGFIRDAKTAAVVFWIIALFAAMTPVSHLFIREEEERTSLLLRQYFQADAVFLSKALCGALFVLFSLVVMAPLF